MHDLSELLERNRRWSETVREKSPGFFQSLVHQQSPRYVWIGCSDSRVPANQIVGLLPGEVFVHRNVGNIVVQTDLNLLSVLQYALDVLKVQHVIVCGHYGCGAVAAALRSQPLGLIDNWLRNIKQVWERHQHELDSLFDPAMRTDRLCELNVIEQVRHVAHTTVVQDTWRRGQELAVHGWIYRIVDGILHDLGVTLTSPEQVSTIYRAPRM